MHHVKLISMIGEETLVYEGRKHRIAIVVLCNHCGTEFAKRKDHVIAGVLHYCSLGCWNAEQKQKLQSETSRVCTKCGIPKSLDEFYDRKDRRGKRSACIVCWNKAVTRNLRTDASIERKQHPEYRDTLYFSSLKMKFDISKEQYLEMFQNQNGCCAICKKPETRKLRGRIARLSVDHDHETCKVRGLLCSKCNTAVGLMDEDIQIAFNVIDYVHYHNLLTECIEQRIWETF